MKHRNFRMPDVSLFLVAPTPPDIMKMYETQKRRAESRMAIVDSNPKGWRDLLNYFPQNAVVQCAEVGMTIAESEAILSSNFGKPLR